MKEFHQAGKGKGKKILFVGESPSARGWHGGYACRGENGNTLPTGKRINELFRPFGLCVDECGFAELCQRILKNRKDMRRRARNDWPVFLHNLKKSKSKLIIVSGVETTRIFSELCGTPLSMGEMKKAKLGSKTYSVLPIYHPSPINPKGAERNRGIFKARGKALRILLK